MQTGRHGKRALRWARGVVKRKMPCWCKGVLALALSLALVSAPVAGAAFADEGSLSEAVESEQAPASESVEYGPQGDDLKMELTSPAVMSSSLQEDTYTNIVASQENGGNLTLTFKPSAGLSQYLNYYAKWGYTSARLAYRGLAGGYMTYISPSGVTEAVSSYGGSISVSSITNTSVSLTVPLGSQTGTAYLLIDAGLHTFLDGDKSVADKYLGRNLVFAIEVTDNANESPAVVDISSAEVMLSYSEATYNTSAHQPAVKGLRLADGTVVDSGYFVSYENNVEPGTAVVRVLGDELNCTGEALGVFRIGKAACAMYAKAAKSSFKKSKKKARKTTIKVYAKAGKVTYKSNRKKVTVSAKGKVVIKKGFKGTATITVKDAGNSCYKAGSFKVKIKVK